jgi:DNA-binding transcriptional LysR family regulator
VHHCASPVDPFVCALSRAHSDTQLDLVERTAQSIEEQLIGAKAEAAVYCRPDRARDPRLNYLPRFREQVMIVLPAGNRLASRETIEINDLAGALRAKIVL